MDESFLHNSYKPLKLNKESLMKTKKGGKPAESVHTPTGRTPVFHEVASEFAEAPPPGGLWPPTSPQGGGEGPPVPPHARPQKAYDGK